MKQSKNASKKRAVEVTIYWRDAVERSEVVALTRKANGYAIGETLECRYPITSALIDDQPCFDLLGEDDAGNLVVRVPRTASALVIDRDGSARTTEARTLPLDACAQVEVALGSLRFAIRPVEVAAEHRRLLSPKKRWMVAAALTLLAYATALLIVIVLPPRIAEAVEDVSTNNRCAGFTLEPPALIAPEPEAAPEEEASPHGKAAEQDEPGGGVQQTPGPDAHPAAPQF